jgi:hypothetical protein
MFPETRKKIPAKNRRFLLEVDTNNSESGTFLTRKTIGWDPNWPCTFDPEVADREGSDLDVEMLQKEWG